MANHHGGKPDPEKLDPRPLEIPLGATRPESLQDTIARFVAHELSQQVEGDPETWEESNDFEEEDPDVLDFSPYEILETDEDLPEIALTAPKEDPDPVRKRTPKEVLDEAYGEGKYPAEWLELESDVPSEESG